VSKASRVVGLAKEYLAYRKDLGFQLVSTEPLLLQFAEYADRTGHRGPLTMELIVRWVKLPKAASPGYLARRLDVVRGFARHRAVADPRTEIPPPRLLGAAYRRRPPHIYSEAELSALVTAARGLTPSTGLRPHTYATLFGLLACTGLRVSEAVKLTRDDIDWRQGLLTIRQTKFRKSRLVPLHATALAALRDYAARRDRLHPSPTTGAFFLTSRGTALALASVGVTFWKLRKQLRWTAGRGTGKPRIHDLRHTFACRRLQRWYADGVDVDHAVAALSTYLGHVTVSHTYWYLTGTPKLLALATARFERFAAPASGGRR
jgi:integrase